MSDDSHKPPGAPPGASPCPLCGARHGAHRPGASSSSEVEAQTRLVDDRPGEAGPEDLRLVMAGVFRTFADEYEQAVADGLPSGDAP